MLEYSDWDFVLDIEQGVECVLRIVSQNNVCVHIHTQIVYNHLYVTYPSLSLCTNNQGDGVVGWGSGDRFRDGRWLEK